MGKSKKGTAAEKKRKREESYEEKSGNRIRLFREEHHLTQEQLGKIVDLTRQQISNFENGNEEIKIGYAIKLANYFGVSLDTLFCNDGYENDIFVARYRMSNYQRMLIQQLVREMEKASFYDDNFSDNNDHSDE